MDPSILAMHAADAFKKRLFSKIGHRVPRPISLPKRHKM